MTGEHNVPSDNAALILVDIQPDFCPGGSLPVAGGDEIVEPVNALLGRGLFGLCVATQDWHPEAHVSFASQHPGHDPMEVIRLYGHPQVLWPDHCVQGTPGAQLHPGIDWSPVSAVIRKGSDPSVDSYSAFRNNWDAGGHRPPTGLAGYLRERGIRDVWLCGLARDVCVKWTAEDAAAAGFRTHFLWDLTRSVDPEGDTTLRGDLERLGVRVVDSADLPTA